MGIFRKGDDETLEEAQYNSIAEFKATTKNTPQGRSKGRPKKWQEFLGGCLLIVFIGFFITRLADMIKLSPRKYQGVVNGQIMSNCMVPMQRMPMGGGASSSSNLRYCTIETEQNQRIILEISNGYYPRKGNRVLLKKYTYKGLFGEVSEYKFKSMSR